MIMSPWRLRPKIARLGRILQVRARTFSSSAATRTAKDDEGLLDDVGNGFYSVNAGTILKGDTGERYEIVRKLGWGVNSTVWMGRDCDDEANPKYVALKILSKGATREHESEYTSEFLMLLRTYCGIEPKHRTQVPSYKERGLSGPPHSGWLRVSGLIGHFYCDQKRHMVIISPLYGENMKSYMRREPNSRLTPTFVKRIAKQTLLALDYLHSHCGIIHSDVKPENILRDFGLGPWIDDLIEAILKADRNAGYDEHLGPLWFPHAKTPDELYVVLSDLSHSSWNDLIQRSTRNVGSPALKAPELVMAYGFSTAVDIWSFGCTIFELLSGKSLFRFSDSRSPNELAQDPHYHLSLMQRLVGEPLFPRASKGTMTVKAGFIDTDGWIKELAEGDTLEARVAKDLSHVEEKDMLTAFLRRCLRISPGDRALASDLMDDPWLQTFS